MKYILFLLIFWGSGLQADTLVSTLPASATADVSTAFCASTILVKSITLNCHVLNSSFCLVGDSNVNRSNMRGSRVPAGEGFTINAGQGKNSDNELDCSTIYFQVGVTNDTMGALYVK